jgi:hypothetical protein
LEARNSSRKLLAVAFCGDYLIGFRPSLEDSATLRVARIELGVVSFGQSFSRSFNSTSMGVNTPSMIRMVVLRFLRSRLVPSHNEIHLDAYRFPFRLDGPTNSKYSILSVLFATVSVFGETFRTVADSRIRYISPRENLKEFPRLGLDW